MKAIQANETPTYQNVMELLVNQEVNKQIRKLPSNLARYIDPVEVATYALNRLPPLYASCEKGQYQQRVRGEKRFRSEITTAVRQALAAVQRDPLRLSTPIVPEIHPEYQAAYTALQELKELLQHRDLLDNKELSWKNLVKVVRRALNKTALKNSNESHIDDYVTQFHDWNDVKYRR